MSEHHDDSTPSEGKLPFAPTLKKAIILMVVGFAVPVAILLLIVYAIHAGDQAASPADTPASSAPAAASSPAAASAPKAASAAQAASAPAAASKPAAKAAAGATTADAGEALYKSSCIACHGSGVAGAPKVGDKAAWAPRIAQGDATLDDHAIHGYTGKAGMMPPKGGSTASDDDVKAAVAYMVSQSK